LLTTVSANALALPIKDGGQSELLGSGVRRGAKDVLRGVIEVCMFVASLVLEKGWWVFIKTSAYPAILFDSKRKRQVKQSVL
jgi:hypothetical protein